MSNLVKPRNKRGSTRTRMLVSAVEVLRERGAAGVTIDEVLTEAALRAVRCTTTSPVAVIRS